MNMAIRGIDFNFGKEPANSFTNDQHPDLRADYVMANPPFNIKEWWDGKLGNLSVYGQESNPTTWRLAAMNMAIRGIDFNFGKEPANSFTQDQHPDLRADYVMANPPFNIKEWWDAKLGGDARWKYGTPPQGNANFAWVQHMLHHLAPNGSMALLLANGSMSSNSSGEGSNGAAYGLVSLQSEAHPFAFCN